MHFENWWKSTVLPNMPPKAVAVIDNATYHSRLTDESKKPTTGWKKALIQEWLREKNARFVEKDTKPMLLDIVKKIQVI